MRLISSAGAEEGRDTRRQAFEMQSSPLACPALDCSPCSPARAEGTWARAPAMGTLPWGSPRSGGAAGSHRAGRRDLCVSGPPKCCTSMQGALVFSDTWPWQQQCQTWRVLAAPPGLGAPSHRCGAHPTVHSRASTTHAYVCVRVLWVAGEGPCCSELLAPSRTIPSCQGRPRHSSRSSSSRRCLSAVPAPVPAPLPSCPRADAGALSTEPRHCVSTSPAMAWLGNARQDALDAGEAGGMGCLVLQAHCWAGWGPHPRQDHEGYSGQGGAQQ